jgi:hypothetical protein
VQSIRWGSISSAVERHRWLGWSKWRRGWRHKGKSVKAGGLAPRHFGRGASGVSELPNGVGKFAYIELAGKCDEERIRPADVVTGRF